MAMGRSAGDGKTGVMDEMSKPEACCQYAGDEYKPAMVKLE